MMKMIVKRGGDDTDTSRNYVYTDWDAVDQFANEFAPQFAGQTEAATA
jgi:menaquinone-dependent protoporphyrinogen oxidase